jgi:DNA-binding beta-propeller fold protein YncE
VYVARQPDLDRLVALKEVSAITASGPLAERLVTELRAVEPLSHPNIVYVYEYFEHEGRAYVAMEYLQRGSLRPLMGALNLAQIAGVLEAVLAGLAHAESRGVFHGDLKPENLMVMREGAVKVADFGIPSALHRATGRFLTASGTSLSTAAYVAPEQVKGTAIGPWTDLYAVGVIAHELLVGSIPFAGETNPALLLKRRTVEEIPSPRSLKPELDPRLSDWLMQLLALEPERRAQRAADAGEQLEEVIVSLLGPLWRRETQLVDTEPELAVVVEDGAKTVLSGTAAAGAAHTVPASVAAGGAAPTVPASTAAPGAAPTVPAGGPVAQVEGKRRSRGRLILLFAIAGALAGGIVAFVVATMTGGSGSGPAGPARLAASERLGLAVGGSSVFATNPSGQILRLDARTLAETGSLSDPARPQSVLVTGDSIVVADAGAVMAFRAKSLEPLGAVDLGRAALAWVPGSRLLAAARTGAGRGQLCVISEAGLTPCADLGFAPTGLGVGPSDEAFVADGAAGTVVRYRVGSDRLTPGGSIAVGPDPHALLLAYRGRLYVPLADSIRVVELSTSQPTARIELAARPESIWIAPSTGRLFATTPGSNEVALIDVTAPDAPAKTIATGSRPATVTGAVESQAVGDTVYVANAGDGTITRLDPLGGEVLGTASVAGLAGGTPVLPARAVSVKVRETDTGDTASIRFGSGQLDPTSVVVRDGDLADGLATVEIWQGGISSAVASKRVGPLSIEIWQQPGRLDVRLRAKPDTFNRVEAGLGADGRAAELEIAKVGSP